MARKREKWGKSKEKVKGREKEDISKRTEEQKPMPKISSQQQNILVCGKVLKQHIGWALSKTCISFTFLHIHFFKLPALIIFFIFLWALLAQHLMHFFHIEIKGIKVHTFILYQ